MMKSSGLSTDPWWTPTFTLNSSLYPSPTRTRLRAFAYIPCTSRTIHSSTPSFLSAHQMTFWGTRSNAFSRSMKAIYSLISEMAAMLAILKIFKRHLLPNSKLDWDETWWEALAQHRDSEWLKLFHSDIQDGCHVDHLGNLQIASVPKR